MFLLKPAHTISFSNLKIKQGNLFLVRAIRSLSFSCVFFLLFHSPSQAQPCSITNNSFKIRPATCVGTVATRQGSTLGAVFSALAPKTYSVTVKYASGCIPPARTVILKKSKAHTSSAVSKYSYAIINSGQNTFGYDILRDGKVVIHQPNIPAVEGNKGFTSKKDAQKTATLALLKISHNIMPPTISIHELDSMHIISSTKK